MEKFNSNHVLNKIEFLADCKSENYSIHNLYSNNLASVRLRTAISAEAAQKLNYKIKISDGYSDVFQNILVIGKVTNITDENRPSRWLKYISESKKKGR